MLKFGLVEKSGNEGLLRQRLRVKGAFCYMHFGTDKICLLSNLWGRYGFGDT